LAFCRGRTMNYNKYLDLLLEGYFKTIKIFNQTFELFKNPDSNEVDTCFGTRDDDWSHDTVRGTILDDTKDLFIWYNFKGGVATHEDINEVLKWKSKPFLPIYIEKKKGTKTVSLATFEYTYSPLQKNYPHKDGSKVSDKIKNLIKNNPNIQSLGYEII
jgi:hypothetical protein